MRRHSCALLLLLLATWATPSSAARSTPLGLRAGLTEARLHGDFGDAVGSKYRPGFGAGAHARFALLRSLSFQPELWWIMKGAREDFVVSGLPVLHLEHAISYVEIPMLLRVQAPTPGVWEPYLVAGPTLALRTSAHEELRSGESPPVPAASSRHVQRAQIFEKVGTLGSQDYADWDWGVAGGAGVAFGRGGRRYVTEVRYSRGFVDVIPSDFGSSPSGTLSVSLGMEWR